ncbi:BMP family lipoprotein [Halosolutus gelatinilyticus]|uniref:BMP family lipoprotein n=1 Tax=Halosolutus gelatinilyticus TaxID=2931975 RepID=UPI001FF581FF|nr:BMP family ABC transporter substrate-binding protein [Halosolutus gelatinilyticus]
MSRRVDAENGAGESDGAGDASSIGRRAVLAAGATVAGGTAIAGCLGGENGDEGGAETNVAIVSSPAGFGDNAFNDNALAGLQRAAEKWDVSVNDVQETEEAEYESTQASLADSGDYDLIVVVGFNHVDALEVNAEEYPDQNWMIINDRIEGADNVSGWIEMNNEMSFLAGVVAGTMTQEELEHEGSETEPGERTIGFVGGEDMPLINAFEQSYVEGAEWIADDVEVLTGYGGSFEDSSAAENVAASQYDDGADIIYHAASAAGTGVFSAAEENGRFAIGVDTDQSVTEEQYQDVIIGSAVKALDEATYEVAGAAAEGNFDDYVGENNLSVEQGAIDFVVGQAFESALPDAVDENLQEAKDGFANDEIELSCGPTSC